MQFAVTSAEIATIHSRRSSWPANLLQAHQLQLEGLIPI